MAGKPMHDLDKASDPIQRALWGRANVHTAIQNMAAALAELKQAYEATQLTASQQAALSTIGTAEVYTDDPKGFNRVLVDDGIDADETDGGEPTRADLKHLGAWGLIEIDTVLFHDGSRGVWHRIILTTLGRASLNEIQQG